MKLKQFNLTPLAKAGVFLMEVQDGRVQNEHEVFVPHTDNHYMLLVFVSGRFRMMLDFTELDISEPTIFLVNPGQVHHILESSNVKGWVINFDPSLVSEEFQQVLESGFAEPLLAFKTHNLIQQVLILTGLMFEIQSDIKHVYSNRIIHEMLSALLALLAGNFSPINSDHGPRDNRAAQIEKAFSKLLKVNFKTWKQPAQYADALSITVAHLNETLKNICGIPVSVYIQQRTILEAKRLLYLTDLSVKEIGYEVGYDDPVYFSRLFKKVTKLTPLQFRAQYHD